MARLLVLVAALVAAATASVASHEEYYLPKPPKSNKPPKLMGSLKVRVGDGDSPNPKQPENPVIAVVTTQCTAPKGIDANTCLDDFYVRWLEAQGTRVVALPIFWPWEQKQALLGKVNGVLFPGGGLVDPELTYYIGNATNIVKYALDNPGFFLWGTCQGFQVISIIMQGGDEKIMTCDYEGMYPSMLPVEFTTYQPYSQLYGKEAEQWGIVTTAATKNSTLNYHHCGIHPDIFKPTLGKVEIISTNVDVTGKPFTSTLEIVEGGRNIFATQYHPERPPYEFDQNAVNHERGTLDISTYISRFVNQRLQRNSHSFSTQDEVNAITFDNYVHTYNGWGGGYYWMKL